MKEFGVTFSLSVNILAQSQQQAQERAEMVADSLRSLPNPASMYPRPPKWWPEEPEVTIEAVTEQ